MGQALNSHPYSCQARRLRWRLVGALSCLSALVGCSLLETRSLEPRRNAVAMKDVPFQARPAESGAPRKRVMVLPFIDNGVTRSANVAAVAREALIKALLKTDGFVVISNSDFPKDLSQFMKSGQYDLEELAKIGNGMGLAAVIEGKVVEIKAKRLGDEVGLMRQIRARLDATVSLRMAASKNGKVVLEDVRSASVEDSTMRFAERSFSDRFLEEDPKLVEGAVLMAFKGCVPKIIQSIDKLNWEGRIAMVKGDRVYLNAGRLSGLQVGDILKITEDGEDVYDPETGALIGRVPGRLKGTVEVISYFGKDGSIAVVHSGSGFRENDLVELY